MFISLIYHVFGIKANYDKIVSPRFPFPARREGEVEQKQFDQFLQFFVKIFTQNHFWDSPTSRHYYLIFYIYKGGWR